MDSPTKSSKFTEPGGIGGSTAVFGADVSTRSSVRVPPIGSSPPSQRNSECNTVTQ